MILFYKIILARLKGTPVTICGSVSFQGGWFEMADGKLQVVSGA